MRKNALFRAKSAFYAHYRFNRNESTGKRANAFTYAKLGVQALNKHFPAVERVFNKNDFKCAEMRYFALTSRFLHISGFNAMKALGNVQTCGLCELG